MSSNSISFITTAERAAYYQSLSECRAVNGNARIKRHWEFLQTSPDAQPCAVIAAIFSGMAAGAMIGARMGQEIGAAISDEYDPEGKVGENIGFFTGMGLGGIGAAFTYMSCQERGTVYHEWRNTQIEKAVRKNFTERWGETDPVLKNFICPISFGIMLTPALTPTSSIFEYDSILDCERDLKDSKYIRDPLRNPSFHEENIRNHYEMGVVVNKRIIHLLRADLLAIEEKKEIDPCVLPSVEKIIQTLEESVKKYYEGGKEKIEEARRNGTLDRSKYFDEITIYFDLFGENPQADLNWERNWTEILKERHPAPLQALVDQAQPPDKETTLYIG